MFTNRHRVTRILCVMRAVAVVSSLLLARASAHAQQAQAPVLLSADHWSEHALRRLYAAGLIGRDYDHATAVMTRSRLRDALDTALVRATDRGDAMLPLVTEWRRLLSTEGGDSPAAGFHGDFGAGIRVNENPRLTGYLNDSTGSSFAPATAAPDTAGAAIRLRLDGARGRFAAGFDGGAAGTRISVATAYAAVAAGPVGAWLGRRPLAHRAGAGGGIILNGAVPLDGLGLWLLDPVEIPLVGPFHAETFLSYIGESRGVDAAWLWGTRLSASPFDWMQLRAVRGTMVGARTGGIPPAGRLLDIVLMNNAAGRADNRWPDNTIVTGGGSLRSPFTSVPLWFYLDWGSDDSAGAWWSMPGIVGGLHLAAIPGLPQADVGVEYAHFDSGQDPESPHLDWYRNGLLRDGWTDELHLLGHPLGGHGREWSAYGTATLPGTMLGWRVFRRDRDRQNVFAPTFRGWSTGGEVSAQRTLTDGWSADGKAAVERGVTTRWSLDMMVRRWF